MTEDLSLAKLISILAREAQLGVQKEIPGFLASRGIESLYHFTSIKNLASISKHGLMGRELLTSKGYDFIASDFVRMEPVENAICLSLSQPNNFMASRKISSGHEGCWRNPKATTQCLAAWLGSSVAIPLAVDKYWAKPTSPYRQLEQRSAIRVP